MENPTLTPARSGDVHHVLADSSLTDERIRVLKHGDTFALFDQYGDIRPSQKGEAGLYHDGTRFLSRFLLKLEGARPFLLSSTVRDDNDQLSVALTNPDLCREGRVYLPMGALHLTWRKLLWMGTLYQELRIENHGMQPVDAAIGLEFAADFADIYEVRGLERKGRGRDLEPELTDREVTLGYRGLDGIVRRTQLEFAPRPQSLAAGRAGFLVTLAPRQEVLLYVTVGCEREAARPRRPVFERARAEARAQLDCQVAQFCAIETGNGQFDALVKRATSDLHMMTTVLPTGLYPYAGVPWFNTPFGRDGIITALECLWLNPSLAQGVLKYLASTQAVDVVPEQDAEPGKILHETRKGEMAALKEMPFARYYGSVDSTPLFVVLAGSYYERTGDRQSIEDIWPNIEAALLWIERYGDRDGDGFLEYHRRSNSGLLHQGWKDSDDAVFHADGTLARGPIALCEVQAYTYAAWRAGAVLATALSRPELRARFDSRAEALRERFEDAFWCDDLSTYALALDGDKQPCRVRASNAGQCLFSGIAAADRAVKVGRTLLGADLFSGWGIRTAGAGEPRYNPMGYHVGSVWPHDNALIAYGMARYGMASEVSRVFTGLFDAAMYFDLHRIPELFCGFPRDEGQGPILYPVACAPQAWSAAAVFLMFQACLGLRISVLESRVSLVRPFLPPFLGRARIRNLAVGGASADLLVVRHERDVTVSALRRDGDIDVVVVM
ncbi:MAG TPA: amylo-alpha-1,6-glucosidase [Bryobacteraceae bacterium]|nr:amylo-alpha-1,6-glucosidase [Bryobacteraceae bacterium]